MPKTTAPKKTDSSSLQYHLIRVLFFFPTLVVVGMSVCIALEAVRAIENSTTTFSEQMRSYSLSETIRNIHGFLDDARMTNDISYSKYTEGKLNLTYGSGHRDSQAANQNLAVIRTHFMHLMEDQHRGDLTGPQSVFVATSDDTLLLYEYSSSSTTQFREKRDKSEALTGYTVYKDDNFTIGAIKSQVAFSALVRPWWGIVADGVPGSQNWSAIYTFQTTNTMGITAIQKLGGRDDPSAWPGSVGVDYELSDLDTFLLARRPTDLSNLILYESNGDIVSMSFRSRLRLPARGRFSYLDVPVPDFKAVGEFLNQECGGFFARLFETGQQKTFTTTISANEYHIDLGFIRRNGGIDWLLVLMVPTSDVLGKSLRERDKLFFTSIGIVAGVCIVSILTAYVILLPLQQLKWRLERQERDIDQRVQETKKKGD
eukprot:PhM_4_TR3464/c0_g2_i1/m.60160